MKKLLFVFCVAFATPIYARHIPPHFEGEGIQISVPIPFAWVKEILSPYTGWWEDNGVRKQPQSPEFNYIP